MKIIKEISIFHYSAKLLDPESRIGKFISKLKSLINNEQLFYQFIVTIKYWDLPHVSLWSFEEVLNYIDDLLFKYSTNITHDTIQEKIIPLLHFLYLIINNSTQKEIFSSFDHLQNIFLRSFDNEVKSYIVDIYMLFTDSNKSLIIYYKDFFSVCPVFMYMRNIFIHLINNNYVINNDIISELEEILIIIHKKWKQVLIEKNLRLKNDEKKIEEINPFQIFKEIINNHKDYQNKNNFLELKAKYEYFAESDIYDRIKKIEDLKTESVLKYLIKDESAYITVVNNFFCIVNDLVKIIPENIDYKKIKILAKYILSMVNICVGNYQYYDEIHVTEYYIESYLKDVLSILTSNVVNDIKRVFLNYCINFINSNGGYENILFQNGFFHSVLSDLTHQNDNNLEILSLEDSRNQNFLKIVLNFLFNTSSFKDMPIHFLNNILEVPKDNIYPYRLDNVIYSLKKKKVYDENVINNYLLPRLVYELEHITVSDTEIKYSFIDDSEKRHSPTTNERCTLISKIFKILIKIAKKTTNINSLNNIDNSLSVVIKKILKDENILKEPDYNSVLINCIYFVIKLCNFFPQKIPNYIENEIFELIFDYFSNYLPKENGLFYLVFLTLYTISIHNKGKEYLLEDNRSIKMINAIFEKVKNDDRYLYYDLYNLSEIYIEELFCPYVALIHVEGLKDIVNAFYDNLNDYMEKEIKIISEKEIEYSEKIKPNLGIYHIEKKMQFILIFFMSLTKEDIKYLEEKCKTPIKSSIKLFLKFINMPACLLCNTLVINHILIKSVSEANPESFLSEIYQNFMDIIAKTNSLNLHQIQKDKIICTCQRIIESSLRKIYFECKTKNFFQNYCSIFLKFITERIIERSDISWFFIPLNNRGLIINSNNYIFILSNLIKPNLRKFLMETSDKDILERELPHCNNYNLIYLNEDNYLDVKFPPQFELPLRVELLGDLPLNSEILTHDLRIRLNILDSFNFILIMGKMIKTKALCDIQDADVEIIKNYMSLSYIIFLIFKTFRKKCLENIDQNLDSKLIINSLLPFVNMLTYINNLFSGKNYKNNSSIVLFYLIKYGGLRQLFKISKKIIYICKNESKKKEVPLIELLLIKNVWNVLSSIILTIIKYQFSSNLGFYLLLIRESEITKKFKYKNELDSYAKYLILNDLIEVFFNKENIEENIQYFNDMEKYGFQMYRVILNVIDSCCLCFNSMKNVLDIEDAYSMGYRVYEVMQCIQEGKENKDKIIKYIIQVKEKEEEIKNKKENSKKNKDDKNKNEENLNSNNNNNNDTNNNNQEDIDMIIPNENNNNTENNDENKQNENINNQNPINNNENSNNQNNNNNNENNNNENDNNENNVNENNNNENQNNNEQNPNNPNNENENNNEQNNNNQNNEVINEIDLSINKERSDDFIAEGKISNLSSEIHLINHNLAKVEELPLYPDHSFISVMINSIDENNSIYKKPINDKNKENPKKHRHEKIEYSLEEFSSALKYMENIIVKGGISINKINDLRKLNIEFRIEELNNKKEILESISSIQTKIDNIKNEEDISLLSDEDKLVLELQYKMQINYSILRYHKTNNLLQENYEESFYEFITKNNLIKNDILSIKSYIPKENGIFQNYNLIRKLIYENLLSIYICFKFLNYFKKDFENEKKLFLDMFMDLLKYDSENRNNNEIYIINEHILIMLLININQNFDDIKVLIPYLKEGLFTKIISLKFNKNDANINFNENKFKYFVTINECFKQFVIKIFSEEKMLQNLIEGVIKYAWANVKDENSEIYVEDFLDLCSEYAKDNEELFEKALLNVFDIVEIENNKNRTVEKDKDKDKLNSTKKVKYAFRLKPMFEKSIQNIKNELKNPENKDKEKEKEKNKDKDKDKAKDKDKDKDKEKNNENDEKIDDNKNMDIEKENEKQIEKDIGKQMSLSQGQSKKKKNALQTPIRPKSKEEPKTQQINSVKKKIEEQMEQISQLFSDTNKSIFHHLLKHIWATTYKVEKDIEKSEPNKIFSRNYIIDLDTSLIALTKILYCFPSYLSLVNRFHNGKKHKTSFFNFIIRNIIPVLNYYHYHVILPAHVNSNEELIDIVSREKNDTLRKYGNRANSYMSFMESFRYMNIITSLVQSMTYKKRNMNDDENLLLNKCRKKLLFELNSSLAEITKKIKDFNSLHNNPHTALKSIILFKSNIIVLFSMTEFHEDSHIYSQYNPFEISNLVFSKDYEIIKNISIILKNMKINNKNEIYHEMGIKYLGNLFKFIRINSKIKIKNKTNDINIDSEHEIEGEDGDIDINGNSNENEENEEDEDNEDNEGNEDEEMLSESDSFSDAEDEGDDSDLENDNFIEEDDDDEEDEDNEEDEENNEDNDYIDEDDDNELFDIGEQNNEDENNENENNNINNNNNDENNNNNNNENNNQRVEEIRNRVSGLSASNYFEQNENENDNENDNENENENEEEDVDVEFEDMEDEENDNDDDNEGDFEVSLFLGGNNGNNNNDMNRMEIIENNDSHSESHINNYHRNISGLRFNFNFLRRRNNDIESACNHRENNDDYALFYNPFLETMNNGQNSVKSEMELYFEESACFPFNIYRYKENNSLILFYKPNEGIKLVNKKNIEIVEKMTNIFLYNYIFPFDISYKRYFNFALIGAKEKTMNFYSKEIERIKENYSSICYINDGWDRKVKREKNNTFKEIKKYLLENGNIIKLEVNKEEKQNEDNKDKDKDKVDDKKDNDKNNKMIDILNKGYARNISHFANMDIEQNLALSELTMFDKFYSPLHNNDEKKDKEKEDKKEEKEEKEKNDANEVIEEKKEEDKDNEDEAKNENNMQIEENEDNNNNINNNESKDKEDNIINKKIEEDKNVNDNKNEVKNSDINNKEENDNNNNKEGKNDIHNNDNEDKNNNNENKNDIPKDINNNENKNDDNNNEVKNENNNEINNNENKNDENKNDENKNDENNNAQNNNENNNQNIDNQFIVELPPDLREEILLNLDPTMVPNLSPDLQQEYHRLVNRNNLMLLDFPNLQGSSELNANSPNEDIIFPLNVRDFFHEIYYRKIDLSEDWDEIRYNKLHLKKNRYTKEEILSNSKHNKEYSSTILQVFDDDFIENLFVYNIKTIITYKQKYQNININAYFQLLNELIMNVHLRHKILDLIFMLWICDSACIKNLSKNKNFIEKNSLIKNLYYLYIEMDLTEDYYFDDYDQFFQNFSGNYQKEMKKYFLQTAYNEKGGYISLKNKKEYLITKNSQNIKEILNLKYDKGENVLSNLLSLIMINSKSDIKKIFSIKIFTNIIQNCFKTPKDEINQNKDNKDNNNKEGNNKNNNNNILHISCVTIEKIIDLFNNFEISLDLQKGTKSNNPTSLLNELMLDNNVYQLLLDVLLKRITHLKTEITNEMDTFFNNKKLDIILFSKPLPEIILFKLIKFINSINNNINKKYYTKSNNLSPTKEEQEIIEKNIKIKKELFAQYKVFIGKISDILFSCWEQLNKLLYDINIMLKDDQKTIASKLNRLIPYLESFITLSHLHFIFYGNNSSASVASKFVIEANYKAEQKSPSRNNLSSFSDSSFIKFFYNFCEKNKKVINIILRRYPKKFPNELIIKISSILDLENKKKYFKQELRKLPYKNEYLRIKVRRNGSELFTDSFGSLTHRKPEQWRSKLMVTFEGEEAVDAGGVRREWLTILAKEMFNPNYMLFTLAKNGTTYTINSDSGKYNPDHLKQFEFVGKIMAKAIFDGMMLDCYFTRIIYKLITNTPLSYHDMEDYDPVFYNSLKWLLENDFTDSDTYLTYSYNHDNLGDMQIVDLIENGRNIDVTEANKFDYVQKLCSSKLYETIKPQVEALLKGFYEIIPQKLISIFNYRELELVISGLPTIDIKDWKNNTEYENYNTESPVIKNFWEIIESFDNDERAEFLQFVTGCSKVPLEGFSALQGIGGVNKFKISKVFEKDFERLPTAHTCTNQLDLPEYPNKEILYERLTFAIKEGKGFGFV